MRRSVRTVARPYLCRVSSDNAWRLSSDLCRVFNDDAWRLSPEEAQRLIDASQVLSASSYQVIVSNKRGQPVALYAATLGGGPAFVIEEVHDAA